MNKDNSSVIWKLILETGDNLKGKLPAHPNHPKGRNPYAHVALMVKDHFGMSYKDVSDDKIEEVKEYLNYLRENPE